MLGAHHRRYDMKMSILASTAASTFDSELTGTESECYYQVLLLPPIIMATPSSLKSAIAGQLLPSFRCQQSSPEPDLPFPPMRILTVHNYFCLPEHAVGLRVGSRSRFEEIPRPFKLSTN
jgi:hypothetical protein